MTVRGACNCGAVAFEADGRARDVYVCHCSICRRHTGGTGIAVVLVETAGFRWLQGEEAIRMWQKPGADWQAWFCGTCGSPVPGTNDATRMFIPAGLIAEGGEELRIAAHLWVGSKAGWEEIGGTAEQHPEGFRAKPG